MTYQKWLDTHKIKHQNILKKLSNLSDDEVIEYFRFENMVISEPDFCLLYKESKKCHDIENLNCYLCACPYFIFDDNGLEQIEEKILYSKCSINSPNSREFISDNTIHQDCSECIIPHKEGYIAKYFGRNWLECMMSIR